MDLDTQASQIKTDDRYYHISFPSIVGICESVFYQHAGNHIRNRVEKIPSVNFKDIHPDANIGLLMSSVFGYTFVRCLNFDEPYKSNLLIFIHAEIYTFQLRGKYYYTILYTDIHGAPQYFTSFGSNPLFFSGFEDGTFTVYNRAMGSIVFQKYYSPPDNIEKGKYGLTGSSYSIWITRDLILGESEQEKIKEFSNVLSQTEMKVKEAKNSSFLEISSNTTDELIKLAGILGTHQVVLQERSHGEFISREEIIDFRVDNIKDFHYSSSIRVFDEGWYIMRKNILSLTHLLDILHIQGDALDGAIDEIDSLQSAHLELQKKISTMTLEDIRDSITIVKNQLSLLIELGKNRIS